MVYLNIPYQRSKKKKKKKTHMIVLGVLISLYKFTYSDTTSIEEYSRSSSIMAINSPNLSLLVLLLHLICCFISTATPNRIPKLSTILRDSSDYSVSAASDEEDFKTYFYDQTLDHFNYNPQSFTKFKQRYVINSKFWGGSNTNSPIFAYFGAEAPLDGDWLYIGFLIDNAPRFKALLVYIEV